MCGIVGYIGREHRAMDVLLDGLRRLEYRGYDSAGVATFMLACLLLIGLGPLLRRVARPA